MRRLNDGSRASKVRLARAWTGELPLEQGEAGEEAAAFAEEVAGVAPPLLDIPALRARAAALSEADMEAALAEPRPSLASGEAWMARLRRVGPGVAGALALAAALLLFLRPPGPTTTVRLKGEAHLGFDVSRAGRAFPGTDETVVQSGDRIRFNYGSGGADTLVIVGVDATGTVQTYWPDEGDAAVAIEPGDHVLPGSIQLDNARGPEVFVAAFDGAGAEAIAELVSRTWAEGGVEGVIALDDARPDLAVLVLEKR